MNTRQVTHAVRLQYWSGIIEERGKSGLSVRAYCRENEIVEKTYYYWQRKLREQACTNLALQTAVRPDTTQFAKVEHSTRQNNSSAITIRLAHAIIEISSDATSSAIESVLRILSQP